MEIDKGKYWDKAWTLISGCTPCSPGCLNCWSAAMTHRFGAAELTYRDPSNDVKTPSGKYRVRERPCFTGKVVVHPERLSIPMKRKKPTVYAIWNDLFHESVPTRFIDDVLSVMAACPQHTFIALTKRAHLIEEKLYGVTHENPVRVFGGGDYLPNLQLGITICNQQEADENIPKTMQVPGKKFLSIEPMLGEINLYKTPGTLIFTDDSPPNVSPIASWIDIDAVILGGETGPGARPLQLDWVRKVRDDCAAAGVPFFLKYLNKDTGRMLDGRTHDDLLWKQP